eukprot:TRINITY_DN66149_c0_g1_i1.p1 TRINITY_DN66149_c0_g1~~TRINITY_DN66149_c0_g1_i1.p1  ORF type:complete len:318 (+),score=34.75 TRINITY_DN66149_c0_g1_i1:102-1055(+)
MRHLGACIAVHLVSLLNLGFAGARTNVSSPKLWNKYLRQWILPSSDIVERLRGAAHYQRVPIIIASRDRMYLPRLIEQLHGMGYFNIIILDNDSTYPPLHDYYRRRLAWVFLCRRNYGTRILWETAFYPFPGIRGHRVKRLTLQQYIDSHGPYVYTDDDVLFQKEVPHNWAQFWRSVMIKYDVAKVGAMKVSDDIPEHYPARANVLYAERNHVAKNFFAGNLLEKNVFYALIDTTFAMYRDSVHLLSGVNDYFLRGKLPKFLHIQVAGDFAMYHLPWYEDPFNPTPDVVYYEKRKRKGDYFGLWTVEKQLAFNASKS